MKIKEANKLSGKLVLAYFIVDFLYTIVILAARKAK